MAKNNIYSVLHKISTKAALIPCHTSLPGYGGPTAVRGNQSPLILMCYLALCTQCTVDSLPPLTILQEAVVISYENTHRRRSGALCLEYTWKQFGLQTISHVDGIMRFYSRTVPCHLLRRLNFRWCRLIGSSVIDEESETQCEGLLWFEMSETALSTVIEGLDTDGVFKNKNNAKLWPIEREWSIV